MHDAATRWAQRVAATRPEVQRVGYFGSYARGDWGVGSDLDLVVIVDRSDLPPPWRAADWDATELPVPADVLVYTAAEWPSLSARGRLGRALRDEMVWIYARDDAGADASAPSPGRPFSP